MTKKSNAKAAQATQGYVAKAIPQTCGNCRYFQCDRVNANAALMGNPGVTEKWTDANLRCGLGEFPVAKTASCNAFLMKKK